MMCISCVYVNNLHAIGGWGQALINDYVILLSQGGGGGGGGGGKNAKQIIALFVNEPLILLLRNRNKTIIKK